MSSNRSFLLQLHGEIDLARADELAALVGDFTTADAQHAVVELTHVTFCDSQGLDFFVRMHAIASDRDGDVTLLNTPDSVRSLLRITNLEDRFRYEERVALRAMTSECASMTPRRWSSLTLAPGDTDSARTDLHAERRKAVRPR